MGLGLIFFGMDLMSTATHPLRESQGFIELMASLDNRLLGALVGLVFTAIIQSSAATTGIVIILASQLVNGPAGPVPMLSLEAGIAIALGANIGTCATALLASIGKPRPAVRAAVVHVCFNVIGTAVWIGLIGQLADMVAWLSPGDGPSAAGRDIANAHTLFNVINTAVFLPFAGAFAWLAYRIIPERAAVPSRAMPRHLDQHLLASADLALSAVRMELVHLTECTLDLLRRMPAVVLDGGEGELEAFEQADDDIDQLYAAIVAYCRLVAAGDLSEQQTHFISGDLAIASACESMADIMTTNLVGAGRSRIKRGVRISQVTRSRIETFHEEVVQDVERLVTALREVDLELAHLIAERKSDMRSLHDQLEAHLEQRLLTNDPDRVHAYSLERDLVDNLHRIYYFAKRAAKAIV
jgi:phosphate:Na+ symporter